MSIINAKKRKKFIMLGIITLVIAVISIAKFSKLIRNDSGWNDIYDNQSETITPTMNIDQIEASLEDVLKQYEGLVNSSNPINKNKTISDLDKLYKLSAKDYTNVTALANSSNNIQILNDLRQGATSLTSSIFEMKDSLMNEGDFSATHLAQSKEDLASAISEIERIKQEQKK